MNGDPALRFEAAPTSSATELRLLRAGVNLPISEWALTGHNGMDLCQRLIAQDKAIEGDDVLVVEHQAVARLSAEESRRLNLPPVSTLRAVVEGNGIMLRPDFAVSLRWVRATGQAVVGARRVGAWLAEADGWRRLPETVFAVAEAVDAYTATPREDEAARLRAIARLREALPQAATAGTADAAGILGNATIIEADAFSLDTVGEGDALQLVPVLHRADGDGTPLLPADRQNAFAAGQFLKWPSARPVYALPGGVYVTPSPPLRRVLEVVRQTASGTAEQRKALLREPRAAIRQAIGDEADAALIESLLVETRIWSDRVIGLGLWQKRVLPWIALLANDWFGELPAGPGDRFPKVLGLQIGDQCVAVTPR